MTTETEYVAPEETEKSEDYKTLEKAIFGQPEEEIKSEASKEYPEIPSEAHAPKKRGRKPGSGAATPKASLVLRLPAELEALYSTKEGRQLASAILELYSLPASQKRIAALLAGGLSPQDCAKGPLSEFAKVELETTIAEIQEAAEAEAAPDESDPETDPAEEAANV